MSIFKNYKIKLVAFVFAFLIWFFVVTDNEYEHTIEVQTSVINLPPGKVILNDYPETVKVRAKGPGKGLLALSLGAVARIELDLSDVERFKTFYLKPSDLLFPRPAGNIRATEILVPDSITVFLDDFETRKVPVASKIQTRTSPGYTTVGGLRITPDSVRISGPKSVVSQIQSIPTPERLFKNLQFDLHEKIELPALQSEKVTVFTKNIEIALDVQKLVEVRKSGIPVEVISVPATQRVRVVPSTLSLILQGGGSLITQVKTEDIRAYIDYERIKDEPGKEHPAVIEPPPGITYRDVEPQKFRLVFEKRF